jgi:hypothetical protein
MCLWWVVAILTGLDMTGLRVEDVPKFRATQNFLAPHLDDFGPTSRTHVQLEYGYE